MTTLGDAKPGDSVMVTSLGGSRGFRRRLMELGLVPGTTVTLMAVAPLGDPLKLRVRGAALSIRRADALEIHVQASEVGLAKAEMPATPLALAR